MQDKAGLPLLDNNVLKCKQPGESCATWGWVGEGWMSQRVSKPSLFWGGVQEKSRRVRLETWEAGVFPFGRGWAFRTQGTAPKGLPCPGDSSHSSSLFCNCAPHSAAGGPTSGLDSKKSMRGELWVARGPGGWEKMSWAAQVVLKLDSGT